jgi:LPXTG-motif cell wall-anchored protein
LIRRPPRAASSSPREATQRPDEREKVESWNNHGGLIRSRITFSQQEKFRMHFVVRKSLTGLAMGVALAGSTLALAQDTGAGTGGASTGATGSTAAGDTGMRTGDNRTSNYGWIGLAGLLGLAGLAGRGRDNRHAHTTAGAGTVNR